VFVSGSRVSFSVVCRRVNGDLVRRAHSVSSLALSSRCPRVVILLISSLSFLCVVPIRLTRSCARRVSLFTARLARVPPARRRRHSHRGTARLGDFRCRGTLRSSTRRPLHNIINSNKPWVDSNWQERILVRSVHTNNAGRVDWLNSPSLPADFQIFTVLNSYISRSKNRFNERDKILTSGRRTIDALTLRLRRFLIFLEHVSL
jgi:hypothetical protein